MQGASISEAVAVASVLHSGKTLKEAYSSNKDDVKYRNIVMCPGHLVEKWAAEIREEVPYAKAYILRTFEELLQVWKAGPERTGKEFYVMSKDFAKLSYAEKPVPVRFGRRRIREKICKACGRTVNGATCKCGASSEHYKIRNRKEEAEGMICPNCNSLLLPCTGSLTDENGDYAPLQPASFAKKMTTNERCSCCGELMWQPYVRNIGEQKEAKWMRITHYANKAKKGTKSVWVHRDFLDDYLFKNGIEEKEYSVLNGEGIRRFDPATFIKKHMKNFFDIAIFDEVHTLKGDTAQGHAMHALVKASKRQIALTGTIAGGYAHHLFYLLFRLDPQRMRSEGFTWDSVSKFSEIYGSIESVYEANEVDSEYSVASRGRKKSEPKVKTGISPLIFTRFLLDKAVMLDISDMSSHLPALHENVVLVDANDSDELEAHKHYNSVVRILKDLAQSGHGMTVLSTMLQYSLSYLDKPYGLEPMLDPLTGQVMVKPKNFEKFSDVNNHLAKEDKLVEIVKAELSEGRNCFIYAEYTNSPVTCVTQRLRDVLMHSVGLKDNEVVILESNTVSSQNRESWIHDKAKKGMKVCIVNPRCVETGRALASAA